MEKLLGRTVADRLTAFDLLSFMRVLPNPDPVLDRLGKRITVYEDLLRDAQVASCMASRKAGVSKLNFELKAEKEDQKIHDFIEETFSRFDRHQLFRAILNCVVYGYQPIEINWEVREGRIVPASIIDKPAEWFCFGENNELRFLSKSQPLFGEELPDMKFVCPTNEATYKNPYGISVLSRCFWPATFKKGDLKFWVSFTEKYGSPWVVGRYALGTSTENINRLADQLQAMIQDAVATVPEDTRVEIIEAAGKGASAEVFDKLKDACNADISKAILGQTLTTDVGSTGSFAASQTHNEVRKDLILSDARIIENTLNQIVRWTVDQNFGKNVPAPVFRFYEPEDVDKQLAERDAILSGIGVRFTPEYIKSAYNLGDNDFKLVDPAPSMFSGHGGSETFRLGVMGAPKDFIDKAAAQAFPPELQQKIMEGLLKPVFKLIEEGESLEEIYEKLGELLPELDTGELQDVLERACTASQLYGGTGGKI